MDRPQRVRLLPTSAKWRSPVQLTRSSPRSRFSTHRAHEQWRAQPKPSGKSHRSTRPLQQSHESTRPPRLEAPQQVQRKSVRSIKISMPLISRLPPVPLQEEKTRPPHEVRKANYWPLSSGNPNPGGSRSSSRRASARSRSFVWVMRFATIRRSWLIKRSFGCIAQFLRAEVVSGRQETASPGPFRAKRSRLPPPVDAPPGDSCASGESYRGPREVQPPPSYLRWQREQRRH